MAWIPSCLNNSPKFRHFWSYYLGITYVTRFSGLCPHSSLRKLIVLLVGTEPQGNEPPPRCGVTVRRPAWQCARTADRRSHILGCRLMAGAAGAAIAPGISTVARAQSASPTRCALPRATPMGIRVFMSGNHRQGPAESTCRDVHGARGAETQGHVYGALR